MSLAELICPHCGEKLPDAKTDEVLEVGDVRLEPARGKLTVGGVPATWDRHGKAGPIRLLAAMMRRPNMLWEADTLLDVLGLWDVNPRNLAVIAHRARKAIGPSQSVELLGLRGGLYTLRETGRA